MSFIFDDDRRGLALCTSNPRGTGRFFGPDVVAHGLCGGGHTAPRAPNRYKKSIPPWRCFICQQTLGF